MSEPRITATHGAGYYGHNSTYAGHKCGRCANPFTGGREDCVNNRPSQTVPYMEGDDD